MKITFTLSSYLAKRYVMNLIILLMGLFAVIYLFDTVELIRRASSRDDIPISLVLQMGLLKLPEVGQTIFPFAVLFSAMYTFWQLTRQYELIVVRASGFSVWQFLLPISAVGIMFGLLQMTVINPVGAVFIGKFEDMERVHLKRQKNQIAVFQEGLWLKQAILIESENQPRTADGEKELQEGYVIVHAQKVEQPDWKLKNVSVFYFTADNEFLQRVDADNAFLKESFWVLNDVTINKNEVEGAVTSTKKIEWETYTVPTTLTVKDIQESFASTTSMSFWKLPAYIRTLEQTGFDATRLRVHYHSLLSQPLMFCAMILLAATVSMRPPRSKGTFTMIASGVFIGFIVFFLSTFLQTLGASQQIPVMLAAWSPALIAFLLGMSAMMNIEDG